MKLPWDIGVGISYNYSDKWIATFDVKKMQLERCHA